MHLPVVMICVWAGNVVVCGAAVWWCMIWTSWFPWSMAVEPGGITGNWLVPESASPVGKVCQNIHNS